MTPRRQPLELFSTFAILEGDYFRHWLPDPRLRRNMTKLLAEPNEQTQPESVWALYWHQRWQQGEARSAEAHLTAYLQEPCYWVAQTLGQRLKSPQYTVADYFQIANGDIQRVLKNFTSGRGSSLKSYASLLLTNTLKDLLRQRQAADVCSDWSLLRKVSKKRVADVLVATGVTEPEISQYRLAWFCFKSLYVPVDSNGGTLAKPDAQLWESIATLYNTQRHGQLTVAGIALTPVQLESRLNQLARWIRAYLYPNVDSLNRTKIGQESGELQDDLSDPVSQDLLDQAIEREEQSVRGSQKDALNTVLIEALNQMEPELKEILQLFYQQNMSQQDMAIHLQLSQPTVSRRIKKAEEKLLDPVLKWREAQLNQFPDPNEIKHISLALKSWLLSYDDHLNP